VRTVEVGDGTWVDVTSERNPLLRHPLVRVWDDTPEYPPAAFDADGFLTVRPRWVCPPHAVYGQENVRDDRRRL
jgi:hypothetical protein